MPNIAIMGGHLTPAISLIQALASQKTITCIYLGRTLASKTNRTTSPEKTEVENLGTPFIPIDAPKYHRKSPLKSIVHMIKLPLSIIKISKILKQHHVDLVFSFGGYLGFQGVIAAKLLGKKAIIHEQTVSLGLANKLSMPFANHIVYAFPSTRQLVPTSKSTHTGNLIRQHIIKPTSTKPDWLPKPSKPIIFITGGSQGAVTLNRVVIKLASTLAKDYTLVHQTGDSNATPSFKQAKAEKNKLMPNVKASYHPRKWISESDYGWLLAHAHLIISRGGANTISEIIAKAIPAIIIPLPHAQNNEQYKNALLVKNAGAGEIITQSKLSKKSLLKHIEKVHKNYKNYKKASTKNAATIPTNATEKVLEITKSTLKNT